MSIPNLKRVRVSSEAELRRWFALGSEQMEPVMLVTYNRTSADKNVSHDQEHAAMDAYGWVHGQKFTLNKSLIGHVIRRENPLRLADIKRS
ncbi:MAG: hypothetical protein ACJAUW_001902 [Yoonia sp.]|jgi:hypothetical protein